jgi:hypothetical protein
MAYVARVTENPYATPTEPPAGTAEIPAASQPARAYGQPPAAYGSGEIGKIRPTGIAILLCLVTLGIYAWVWYYKTFDEMRRHRRSGFGGGLSILLNVLSLFIPFASLPLPYLSSSEVGQLYELRGEPKPVSGLTGLWFFPGLLIIVGPIVWFVKTNGALNRYWESLGATR